MESEKLPAGGSKRPSSVASSGKFSYWSHWRNMNKLGGDILRGGRSSDILTAEGLEFHNNLHGSLPRSAHINTYISSSAYEKCSPYYRGLAGSTLVLNREKGGGGGGGNGGGGGGGGSPGRDSIITSTSTISSYLSTFAVKVHELTTSSCAKFACGAFVSAQHKHPATTSDRIEGEKDEKVIIFADDDQKNKNVQKPLRERKVAYVEKKKQKPLRERISPRSRSGGGDHEEKEGDCKISDEEDKMSDSRYKWADMYRPKTLEDFICNRSKALLLKEEVKEGGCRHLIFQGPAGVGKNTMILAMLREAFGDDKIQIMSECKEIKLKGEGIDRIQVRMKKSEQHYEVKISDLKGYEKNVIVELMKETQMLNAADPSCECRAIVLFEADKLGTDALMYIKWLLERYKGKNKVLFSCSDVSKLQPLMSVCTVVELLQASRKETVKVLEFIAEREGIDLSRKMAEKITDKSNNNLRQAIRSFEATWHARHVMEEDEEPLTGWEDDIAEIAKNIIDERTPRQLYIIRGKLQNLIEYQVSPECIFQFLVRELKKRLPNSLRPQLEALYAEYTRDDSISMVHREKLLLNGCRNLDEEGGKALHDPDPVIKNIHHFLRIEEFTAKFMSWYNYQSRISNASTEPHN